jgi:DNA-binding GntR family transcriptional regulator
MIYLNHDELRLSNFDCGGVLGRQGWTDDRAGAAGAAAKGSEAATLAERAYRSIKSDIINGVRVPGERLRIEQLRTIYKIGPTPLREALQRLSVMRLVIAESNRGFTVAPFDPAEFVDLNIARVAIEKEALRMSLQKGGVGWEGDVVAALYVLEKEDKALSGGAGAVPDSWDAANVAFHSVLVSACGSEWLLWVRSQLNEQCERYRRAAVAREIGSRSLHVEHAEIAEAALARDADRLCDLITRHYNRTAQMFA